MIQGFNNINSINGRGSSPCCTSILAWLLCVRLLLCVVATGAPPEPFIFYFCSDYSRTSYAWNLAKSCYRQAGLSSLCQLDWMCTKAGVCWILQIDFAIVFFLFLVTMHPVKVMNVHVKRGQNMAPNAFQQFSSWTCRKSKRAGKTNMVMPY